MNFQNKILKLSFEEMGVIIFERNTINKEKKYHNSGKLAGFFRSKDKKVTKF